MSTSLSLDALVVSKILLFADIRTDWNLLSCLPCFISKTFAQVFSSEGFAKEYVIMLFKLDRDLEKQLENCIKTHNTIVGERNRMTFQKILHEYKKCCNALAKAKRDALENLENFGELNDDDQERSIEKATMELGNAMKTFFEHSLRLDYLCEPSMIIPRDELKKLFRGGFQEVFVKKVKKDFVWRSTHYTVFTGCGFPISIKATYYEAHDMYTYHVYHERVKINGQELFVHHCNGDFTGLGTRYESNFSSECLKYILSVLLDERAYSLMSLQKIISRHGANMLNVLLYKWLQLGLFEHADQYETEVGLDRNGLPTVYQLTLHDADDDDH